METALRFILYAVAVLSAAFSLYHSVKSKKSTSVKTKGLSAAKMNIGMGLTLISVAIIQFVLFPYSLVRTIVIIVFLLLGGFNGYAGLRNHAHFRNLEVANKDS